MATRTDKPLPRSLKEEEEPESRPRTVPWPVLGRLTAVAAVALAGWALSRSISQGTSADVIREGLVVSWSLAALALALRRPSEPLGAIVALGAALGAAGSLFAELRPWALGLVPAVGFHAVLGAPDGRLGSRARRVAAAIGYAVGVGAGAGFWSARPTEPGWAVAALASAALLAGAVGFAGRYPKTASAERRRMKWLAWAITVAAGLAVVVGALRVLLSWQDHAGEIAAAATVLVPLALVLGASDRFSKGIDALLVHTISLAGLTAVVVGVYFAIVLGLGRVPRQSERVLLVLSMVAAVVAALLYLPTRSRLSEFANRVVYGERHAPDDVLRNFGSRLSRAVPLDELLLQMAESLRKTLALSRAEVWTVAGDHLELSVSEPERRADRLRVEGAEATAVARAGVSGNAWIKVWLPELLAGRDERSVRLAPVTHSGELLGAIVVERDGERPFVAEDDQLLAELARQVGLTLHNVRLDSALQASLDEVRRHAEALQASRGRIVAAADAERRRIERNLHDGAQQHLVALAVKIRLSRQLLERDPAKAETMLEELAGDVEDTLQELRDLAHGIYPPLLADKGLPEALASAARRATIPTEVDPGGIGRFSAEIEAAVYFCCLEALQNAGKHAGESAAAKVRLWEEAGGLLFEVADDGAGFDVRNKGSGVGFTNMADRLGAIGGTVRVESAPGRGTRILGRIPLPHHTP